MPLSDIKVLDLSRVLAGPYCSQFFADLGAEVWKIESLQGDDTRHWGPPFEKEESAYFLSTNRGKKGLGINLKDVRGQKIVTDLAQKADVLLENFKVGDLKRYSLDYNSLRILNPQLIYASITGFGQTGPRAKQAGYDVALQGMSGLMSITGEAGREPVKVGVAWIDVLTGLHTAVAILAALHERGLSGQGQQIDIALFDVALASLVNQTQAYFMSGNIPEKMGSAHPQLVPYQAFEARDVWFILGIGNDVQYKTLCETIDAAYLWQDERFQSNAGRVAQREELVSELKNIFKKMPRAHWLDLLTSVNVPVSPVNNLEDALNDPQVAARKMIEQVSHTSLEHVKMLGSPLQHMSRTPASPKRAAPLHGEHTADILKTVLNYSGKEIEELRQGKAIL